MTLRHVAQAGSSSGDTSIEELSRKRAREEENDQEYKEMFKAAFSDMDEQRKEMTAFIANFNRFQRTAS